MNASLAARLLFGGFVAFSSWQASAQAPAAWPNKPIRVVVPFPAGGPTDITARVVGQALSTKLGVPFVVENKAGGRGFIGTSDAARAPADGYTLLVSSIGAMAINPRLYEKLPYDSVRDFAPVSLLVTVPIVVVVNPEVLPCEMPRSSFDSSRRILGRSTTRQQAAADPLTWWPSTSSFGPAPS